VLVSPPLDPQPPAATTSEETANPARSARRVPLIPL
jgi:hypothetical protein